MRVAHLIVAAGLLAGGNWMRSIRLDPFPFSLPASAPTPRETPTAGPLPNPPDPGPPPFDAPFPPAAAFGQGIVAVWHGRLETPLRSLGPAPTRDLELPVTVSIPVDASRRIPVRLSRYDFTGPDAGVFSGEVPGHPGATVVLSYVGAAQAGLIYLPEEGRSYVINGGDDGRIRVITTDLATAPGCAEELPRPPVAAL